MATGEFEAPIDHNTDASESPPFDLVLTVLLQGLPAITNYDYRPESA